MSDVAKFFSNAAKGFGDVAQAGWRFYGDAAEKLTGSRGLAANTTDKIADLYRDEVSNKSDLRGAETETFLSGLPYVGDMLRGIEGVNQLEDLYAKTGKLPAYPASQGLGAGAVGHSIGQIAQKVADGKNDLYEYYSGSPDDFRAQMNNMYG